MTQTLDERVKWVVNKSEEMRCLLGRCANLHPDSQESLGRIINYLLNSIHAVPVTGLYSRITLESYPILIQLIRDMQTRIKELEAKPEDITFEECLIGRLAVE